VKPLLTAVKKETIRLCDWPS